MRDDYGVGGRMRRLGKVKNGSRIGVRDDCGVEVGMRRLAKSRMDLSSQWDDCKKGGRVSMIGPAYD